MSEYIVEMYDECEKYFSEYGCKPTNTQGFPLREEIVRCRDCRWAKPDHSDHEYRGEYRCNMWIADVDAYGFCFRAIRKEGGDE